MIHLFIVFVRIVVTCDIPVRQLKLLHQQFQLRIVRLRNHLGLNIDISMRSPDTVTTHLHLYD